MMRLSAGEARDPHLPRPYLAICTQLTRFAALIAGMRSAALRWIDGLWGYDVFIAHRRIDGASYAGEVNRALEARLIKSFLDVRVYKPGDSIARETIRNARKSTLLLFVGSPASVVARENDWLELELKSYFDTHDEPKVVVVDFGGAIRGASDQLDHPLRCIADVLRIEANVSDLEAAPHSHVLSAVEDQLSGRRVERRRTQVFGTLAAVMSLLLIVAIVAGIVARQQRGFAVANETRALAALATSVASTRPTDALKLALAAWPRNVFDSRPPLQMTLNAISRVLGAERLPLHELSDQGRFPGATFLTGGRRVLEWSREGTIRLWDARSGRLIEPVFRHGGEVVGARFLENEKILVSWSLDGTVRFWDAATGLQTGDPIKTDKIERVVFSPDEQRLVLWNFLGKPLRIWDVKSRKPHGASMEGGVVWGVAFSSDGKRLLSWGADTKVRLWNALDGSQLVSPLKHRSAVDGAVFSHDGAKILSWSRDATVRLWDAADGTGLGREMRHDEGVLGARFTRDERHILSWSLDGTVRLWDAFRTERIGPVMHHGAADEGAVDGAVFSSTEDRILSWSRNGTVRLWDVATGAPIGIPMRHRGGVRGAHFTPNEQRIFSWSEDETVRLWDAATGAAIGPAMKHGGPVYGAFLSPDGTQILSWSSNGAVRLWSSAADGPTGPPIHARGGIAVVSDDLSRLLHKDETGTLSLWDIVSGELLRRAYLPGDIREFFFNLNSPLAAYQVSDQELQLVDLAMGAIVGPRMRHEAAILGTRLDRFHTRLLTWSVDGTVRGWDTKTGHQSGATMPHPKVKTAFFERGGRYIVSWSDDDKLLLWDATTGLRAGSALGPWSRNAQAIVTQDGSRVFSWGIDQRGRLWNTVLDKEIPLNLAHSRFSGALLMPDGKRILSWGSTDAGAPITLQLWDSRTGASRGDAIPYRRFEGPLLWASPEGTYIIVVKDSALSVLDPATGEQIGPVMPLNGNLNEAYLTPDGKHLVADTFGGPQAPSASVKVWDLQTRAEVTPAASFKAAMAVDIADTDVHFLAFGDGTYRVWRIGWPKGTLIQGGCHLLPDHDVKSVSQKYGITIADPICNSPSALAFPGWSQVVR